MSSRRSPYLLLHLTLKGATVLCLATTADHHRKQRQQLPSSSVVSSTTAANELLKSSSSSSSTAGTIVAGSDLPSFDPTDKYTNHSSSSVVMTSSPSLLATASSDGNDQSLENKDTHPVPTTTSNKSLFAWRNKPSDEPSVLSKLVRRMQVFLLAGRVFLSYKTVQWQEKTLRKRLGLSVDDTSNDDDHPEIVELWNVAHERNAQFILRNIEQLQGFWIKVGQYLSSRADVMPPQYLRTLASLQDGVPKKPFADIQRTLSEQLPPEKLDLIQNINPEALSTASLAQVHRSTLKDGRDVVLKVQHRGVASLMIQDMENLRTILQLLSKMEPDMDYQPVVDEYTREVRKELDFRIEAHNMQLVKDLLASRKIRAVVPAAIPELVTEKCLVMEYCEGFPIRDIDSLDKYKVDRRLLLERVCTSWAAQMHIGGRFNADPHPGNLLVSTNQVDNDPSVPILLDFGLTKCFSPEMKVAFSRLVHSSYETDVDGLLQSFEEMGLKLNRYDPFQDMQVMQASFADPAPQSEAAEAKKQRAKDRKEMREAMQEDQGLEKGQKLRNPVDAWPSELIFFTRVSAMLRGLCSRLDVRYPYLECMSQAASETLRESIPLHEHAEGSVYESPEKVYDSELHKRLRDLSLELIDEDHAIGMQVCVIHKGETVANIAAGELGTVNPRPVTPSSLFNIFSSSKAVLATGVLRMLEEKEISVDDPIAKYWPKFGASHDDKKLITIRHALSHQSGLADSFPANASIGTLTDWEHMKKFIASADAVPSHKPGLETHYHYLTFAWLLGGLIEEVTGQPYKQYLMEHLIEPLGLENELHMGGLPDDVAREELAVLTARTLRDESNVAKDMDTNKKPVEQADQESKRSRLAKFRGREQMMNPSVFNMRKVRSAKIPSANGHASAHSLAVLMNAVTTKGNQILSSDIMQQARTPQQSSVARGSNVMLDNSLALFGLGYQIHELTKLGTGNTVRSIGHAGFGGSIVISIPEMELTIAFTTNQLKLKSVARDRVLGVVLEQYGLRPPKSLID